jgi:hypothetical protein
MLNRKLVLTSPQSQPTAQVPATSKARIFMITEHGGRIIDTAGDGILAEFSSQAASRLPGNSESCP